MALMGFSQMLGPPKRHELRHFAFVSPTAPKTTGIFAEMELPSVSDIFRSLTLRCAPDRSMTDLSTATAHRLTQQTYARRRRRCPEFASRARSVLGSEGVRSGEASSDCSSTTQRGTFTYSAVINYQSTVCRKPCSWWARGERS
jgi:hypothetical protein